jgi:hypothetical protein
MTYAFNVTANFPVPNILWMTVGSTVLSKHRLCDLGENPQRTQTLQRCLTEAGSRWRI